MSAEEFREALKKSHEEISTRLGSYSPSSNTENTKSDTGSVYDRDSLSERNSYITSAQGRIDRLSHKIHSLQNHYYDNWGYAERDARKLRDLQSRARDELNKIRRNKTDGWKNYKRTLESILRQTSDY